MPWKCDDQTCACCSGADMGALMVADMLKLWPGEKFIPTDEIVAALIEHRPSAWGDVNHRGKELTAQRIGSILGKGLGIRSVRNHVQKRGYCIDYIEWRTAKVAPNA